MATGRAVITTDAPGCREPVEPDVNGYVVPVRDPARLADAMTKFIADPTLAVTMGAASRRIAENRYDVRKVNTLLLEAMELNGGSAAPIIVSPNRGRGQRMVDFLLASMAPVAAAPLKLGKQSGRE